MEDFWSSNPPLSFEPGNLGSGDVAVCGLQDNEPSVLSALDDERVAYVAPLDSRADLEWLLRGLLLQPSVQHIVVCGEDRTATGEALIALLENGLNDQDQLPGSRGRLAESFSAAPLDTLRANLAVRDLRDRPLADIASAIAALPALETARERVVLAKSKIPERKVFLSRKTSFPIFSSHVADAWLQLMNLCLRIGTSKQPGTAQGHAEALNAMVTIETPVLEDGEQEQLDEFPTFLEFNRDDFESRFALRYGERFKNWKGFDQYSTVCERLEASRDTRSGTLVLVDPAEVVAKEAAPHLISATFNIVDDRLYASFVFRRCDVYTEFPLEATALVRLQKETAARLGVEAGTATFVIHSAHLYEHDFERAMRLLREHFKRPLPLHVDPSGVFLFGSDNGKARAMLLNHDASEIMWEEAFSDPEDLSWYIVDVMPWLLPQHIRYVGQECAALMRAMRERECYLQG